MSTISTDARIAMLRTMERIRAFEVRVGELFADNEIPGFVHLYIGEEAIAAGVCQALDGDDYITSTHRGHGHCIAKGHELEPMMAELFGKSSGYCAGKGGSMHIADPNLGNLGANGIVGAGYPIGVGAALSSHLRDAGEVVVSFAGDGSLAQGSFHESMNLASLWGLPYVAVVENNKFGEYSATDQQQAVEDLTDRAESYGIPSESVDGMDPDAVYDAAERAVERAQSGEGPTLLECDAYRFRGHHEGDSQFYRDDDEVEAWRERDPLPAYRERLQEEGVLDEDGAAKMRVDAESAVEDAVEFARESPFPESDDAYRGLYAEEAGR